MTSLHDKHLCLAYTVVDTSADKELSKHIQFIEMHGFEFPGPVSFTIHYYVKKPSVSLSLI
jgi:hypothetical protein